MIKIIPLVVAVVPFLLSASANPIGAQFQGAPTVGDIVDWSAGAVSRAGSISGGPKISTTWSFEDCGVPEDVIHIKSLEVDPDPPKPGQQLTVRASGTVDKVIEEGAYADVVVKLGLIKLLSRRFDVCEELRQANSTLQCPVQPGDYEVVQSVNLPREIPRAKFTVLANAYTVDEEDMTCAKIVIDFMH